MSYVFISYKRQNYTYARLLADTLLQKGFDVWIDDNIEPSEDWFDTIVKAIEDCAAFIVIMTPLARESNWIKRERLLAEDWNKAVFPLLLEGANWPFYIHKQCQRPPAEAGGLRETVGPC